MKTFIALFLILVSASVYAQGGILQLQGKGGTFTAPLDAQGNATINNVKPGNYVVALLVPAIQKVRMAANTTSGNDKHKNEIEILSWSWGETNSSARREASTPSVSEIVVTKNADASSPALMKKMSPGMQAKLEKKVTHNGQEYYKVKLTDILVSSVQSSSSSSSSGDRPQESLSLNFTKIIFTYKE